MKPLRLLATTLLLPWTLAAADYPRTYENKLVRLQNPPPLLADHPEFVAPVRELVRYEAPTLVDDASADLLVRAWRFSYNARGVIEMPNRLRADDTAIIFVHPWGIDDGQGWRTPEPAGVADFCTLEKNKLAARHTREVIVPFIKSLRGKVKFVMHSLPGSEDPIRRKLYRSFTRTPAAAERAEGAKEFAAKLNAFNYRATLCLRSSRSPRTRRWLTTSSSFPDSMPARATTARASGISPFLSPAMPTRSRTTW